MISALVLVPHGGLAELALPNAGEALSEYLDGPVEQVPPGWVPGLEALGVTVWACEEGMPEDCTLESTVVLPVGVLGGPLVFMARDRLGQPCSLTEAQGAAVRGWVRSSERPEEPVIGLLLLEELLYREASCVDPLGVPGLLVTLYRGTEFPPPARLIAEADAYARAEAGDDVD